MSERQRLVTTQERGARYVIMLREIIQRFFRYHQTRLDLSVEVDTEDSEPRVGKFIMNHRRDYSHLLLHMLVSYTVLVIFSFVVIVTVILIVNGDVIDIVLF